MWLVVLLLCTLTVVEYKPAFIAKLRFTDTQNMVAAVDLLYPGATGRTDLKPFPADNVFKLLIQCLFVC